MTRVSTPSALPADHRDRPVRVLANAISASVGGGATYALEQLDALSRRADIDLTVVTVEPAASRLKKRSPNARILAVPRRPLGLRLFWEQSILAWRSRQFDVVYGVGNFALLATPVPQVVTFQNPNHFGAEAVRINRRFSPASRRFRLRGERWLARGSLRRAAASIAISKSIGACILEDLPDAQPYVVLSATPSFGGADDMGKPPEGLPSEYLLAVANDYPHKDWAGLIRAVGNAEDLPPLVLVGEPRPSGRPALTRGERLIMWGPERDPQTLRALYRNAQAFVAHSHLEAFPLTPFEALSQGTRLVASDIPSHREVCGSAAEYYEPNDPRDLADAVRRVLRSPAPAPVPGQRSWEDNAAELATVMRTVAVN